MSNILAPAQNLVYINLVSVRLDSVSHYAVSAATKQNAEGKPARR